MTLGAREGPPLASTPHRVADYEAAVGYCEAQGWTDGLPAVPPTAERVWAMLAAARREPSEVVGRVPARHRTVTVEKVAINAVMAGCEPPQFPVLLAAVEAMLEPAFGVHGPTASTSGAAVLLVVNGPAVTTGGFNAGENLFGSGPVSRANIRAGRAVRLLLLNVLGSVPGRLDRSCFGHPGKIAYCIAEDEVALAAMPGWAPLAAERGVPAGRSAVTVMAAQAPCQVTNGTASTAEPLVASIADAMVAVGRLGPTGIEYAVVVAAEHRRVFAAAGWSKADVRRALHGQAARAVDGRRLHAAASPGDIHVVAAGGPAGGFTVVIPGWVGPEHSRAVTRAIAGQAASVPLAVTD